MPNHPLRLHRHPLSGHCHRVEVFLRLIGQDFESLDVDLAAGAHKQAGFLALNAFGEVPVLEHGDIVLADSNAILVYLARTLAPDWYPEDPLTQARIQRFLSMAAGDIAFGPAAARLITVFGAPLDADRAKSVAVRVFERLEAHLDGRTWLVGDRATIADIAIYSYSAHAPEGGISLAPYPRLSALLDRIRALPGFAPMAQTRAGLVA
jgi:glutathione S-transferase